MDDTISRAAALDALGEEPPVWYDGEDEIAERNQWRRDVAAIKALPPAQPVNIAKLQPNCNQVASDCISRQAAIDALEKVADMFPWRVPGNRDTYDRYNEAWNDAIGRAEMEIENMPSAQPGWIPWDSGRFPEESGTYTVTVYDGATKRVTYAKYQKRLKRWELTGARAYWRVLAWMPYIEPWEGGQDETD